MSPTYRLCHTCKEPMITKKLNLLKEILTLAVKDSGFLTLQKGQTS